MAGSFAHCVNEGGGLRNPEELRDSLDNFGDVYEAIQEMHKMIFYLSGGDERLIDEARQHGYQNPIPLGTTFKESLISVASMVEGLADEIYPTDIFPVLSPADYDALREVERQFPNLSSRISTSAYRRACIVASKRIREMMEDD